MLINEALDIKLLDGNTGYHQIFMAKEDMSKTAFRCPSFVSLFEWVVMTSFEKYWCNLSKSYEFDLPWFAWCHLGSLH